MKVLVTGATGFIGRHLCHTLLSEGLGGEPVSLTVQAREPARLPDAVRAAATVLESDLAGIGRHREALHACDVVFHLAAAASVGGGVEASRANEEGTRALVAALAGSPRLERLVYASSIGAVDRAPGDRCDRPLSEEDPAYPLTGYGRSKRAGEELIAASGLPYTTLRPTWVYGPGMRADSHVRFFLEGVRARRLPWRVRFPGRVSLVHVADLVNALTLVAREPRARGQVYFAAAGEPLAIGELLERIGRIVGEPAGIWRVPGPLAALARAARPRLPFAVQLLFTDLLCADAAKLRALGWAPRLALDDGLRELARWSAREARGGAGELCVVTGAASGIGRALATQLHADGEDLVLVDRARAPLEEVCAQLAARPLVADLSRAEELERLAAELEPLSDRIAWVVNCAGIGCRGRVAELEFADQRRVLDVNATALVFLSRLACRWFAGRGRGVLVNVASSASFQPLAYMAVYAASKAFVLSFTEALGMEQPAGVQVLAVCPSGTATAFQASAGVRDAGDKLLAPHEVASAIRDAVRRGASGALVIGRSGRAMALLARLLPRRASARLWKILMERMR